MEYSFGNYALRTLSSVFGERIENLIELWESNSFSFAIFVGMFKNLANHQEISPVGLSCPTAPVGRRRPPCQVIRGDGVKMQSRAAPRKRR